ncbi:cytochrome b/b6 domain-containing protein (plasmid) [Rhizobium sp. CB3060]|uniref:cytochrome b/b6 domain-containing protein n=1 Tax=Rhizobium sp. CB3060 TaxID=3138255 RepID=UPI0021A917E7|nr:cytochrome b/b6 domain-containing protein [Rhizobium tropici]UWU26190.1 cytochrome b/b6 domain-containing protein [Rhizobium tropici]
MNFARHPRSNRAVHSQYDVVAIGLHWATAVLVTSMIPMGWWMVRAIENPDTRQLAYQLFQIHKSIGFVILALTLVRIFWRLTHPVPALPSGMKGWERFLARATHVAFYALLLAIPLTGWVYVSVGWAVSIDRPLLVATSWFGLFPIPHLPAIEGARSVAFGAMGTHAYLAYGGTLLIALHVAAALKHQFMDKDGVLAQMVPFLRGSKDIFDHYRPAGSAILPKSSGVFAVLLIGALGYWSHLPNGPAAEPVVASETVDTSPTVSSSAGASTEANASLWTVDNANSSIRFSGSHADRPFEGYFGDWSGDIRFDPDNLAGSRAIVVISTGSARTGDPTQEGSLKAGEWFNTGRFPEAEFETIAFRSLGGDRYSADATLTIKNKSIPIVFPFTYQLEGDEALVEGEIEVDRSTLDLGMFSDPSGDWVSKLIRIRVSVVARKD